MHSIRWGQYISVTHVGVQERVTEMRDFSCWSQRTWYFAERNLACETVRNRREIHFPNEYFVRKIHFPTNPPF